MRTSYVYGLYDISGTCLYVGQSVTPKARLCGHRTATGLFRDVPCVMRVLRACTEEEVNRLEVQIMLAYRRRGEATMNRVLKAFGRPLLDEEDRAATHLHFRVTPKRKAAYRFKMSHASPQLDLISLGASPERRCAPSRGYISGAPETGSGKGLTLTEWILNILDKASGYKEDGE